MQPYYRLISKNIIDKTPKTGKLLNMEKLIILSLLAVTAFPSKGFGGLTDSIPDKAPNVIYINIDDLGWKDVGFMGGTFFETPNIDQLASQGLTFTHSYAAAANCAPSRACLMTGQNTPRHGIYTVSPSARGKSEHRKIIPVKNTNHLPNDSTVTLPALFRQSGYTTAIIGKWHLGDDPTLQGFDVNIGGYSNGSPGKDGYYSPYNVANLEDGPIGENLTDRLTTEAIDFLNANHKKSFFLYLPYYAVHTPLMASDNLVKKYSDKKGNEKMINPVYAAMVETLDTNIGRLQEVLTRLELWNKTIVIFTSDNGGIRSISTQEPLRAGKGSYYEGGTRVPTIVRWPGLTKAGTTTNQPIVSLDFYPTFLNFLNLEANRPLDGLDIAPILAGRQMEVRPFFWHFPIYLQAYDPEKDDGRDPLFRTRPGSTIRYGDWKLHQYFEDGGIELYNLSDDSGERLNENDKYPEKTNELLGMLQKWREDLNAPIPKELNPNFNN